LAEEKERKTNAKRVGEAHGAPTTQPGNANGSFGGGEICVPMSGEKKICIKSGKNSGNCSIIQKKAAPDWNLPGDERDRRTLPFQGGLHMA